MFSVVRMHLGEIDRTKLLDHRQITDAYLLSLAVHHAGRLVTLDRRIDASAVRGATGDHLVQL